MGRAVECSFLAPYILHFHASPAIALNDRSTRFVDISALSMVFFAANCKSL